MGKRQSFQRARFRDIDTYRTEQAGIEQGRIFAPMFPSCEGDATGRAGFAFEQPLGPFREMRVQLGTVPFAVRRKLLVANQAIWPKIDDFYFEVVFAGFGSVGDVGLEWRLPKNATVSTVQFDLGDDFNFAQIEKYY